MNDDAIRIKRVNIRHAVRQILREQIMSSMMPPQNASDSMPQDDVSAADEDAVSFEFTMTVKTENSDPYAEVEYDGDLIFAEVGQAYSDPNYPGCTVTLNSIEKYESEYNEVVYGDHVEGYEMTGWQIAHGTLVMTSECFNSWATNGWGNDDAVKLQVTTLNPEILPLMKETVSEIMFNKTLASDPNTTIEVEFTNENLPQSTPV